ncbi:hypothetical protein BHE74_00021634 [Ensete ventricosum]|nr:hypothetical protein BHE74_00021634 [Ensete ventricosum]
MRPPTPTPTRTLSLSLSLSLSGKRPNQIPVKTPHHSPPSRGNRGTEPPSLRLAVIAFPRDRFSRPSARRILPCALAPSYAILPTSIQDTWRADVRAPRVWSFFPRDKLTRSREGNGRGEEGREETPSPCLYLPLRPILVQQNISSNTQRHHHLEEKQTEEQKKMRSMEEELFPSTPGKVKIERAHTINRQLHRSFASTSTMFLWALFLIALTASYLSFRSFVDSSSRYLNASWGGMQWEKQIRESAAASRPGGMSVLVTGAAGFVGTHVSLALRRRGDGVVGLDNFNNYYDPSLKKARQAMLQSHGVFVVEGDINDTRLLDRLFALVPVTHVMHLAAQAGVRYAIENPASYVHSNIAGLVTLLEVCKSADPQPAVVWASSSSVYGLNEKVPFSELDRTDRPASLYAATKKAGEEITHTYNHIYGLSTTALRFFTVYGPWGRPDMAYFSFTRNILQGKPITVYRGKDRVDLARDFTYIDDIVKGCVASLDTAEKSTGSGGRKRGPAQYRIYNLGNTSPVTVPALVNILERHLKVKAKKKVVEMPGNGDVPFTHANISFAQAELGYKPTTNLEIGLKKFVKWYLSYYGYKPRSGGLAA